MTWELLDIVGGETSVRRDGVEIGRLDWQFYHESQRRELEKILNLADERARTGHRIPPTEHGHV